MHFYNIHTHTHNSHDSNAGIKDVCEAAVRNGLSGFAVTDHCDCEFSKETITIDRVKSSVTDSLWAKEHYSGRLNIGTGIEIGEILWDKQFAHEIISGFNWDIVLASVHAVRIPGMDMPFSLIDFSDKSDTFLAEYMKQYFYDMREMIDCTDFDCLSHLTIPLRYIRYKYGKDIDLTKYYGEIEDILKVIIQRDISLEINTSGCTDTSDIFFPDEDILSMYLSLGGNKITVGSDAHIPEKISNGLDAAGKMLLRHGVTELVYYENRKAVNYNFTED